MDAFHLSPKSKRIIPLEVWKTDRNRETTDLAKDNAWFRDKVPRFAYAYSFSLPRDVVAVAALSYIRAQERTFG